MRRSLAASLSAVLLAAAFPIPSASAQGSGLTAGDMYLLSGGLGALVRVDLSSGTASIAVDTSFTPAAAGAVVFDPYRQRIVFRGSIGPPSNPPYLWAVDGAGNLDPLILSTGPSITAMSPTGDGRIYMRVSETPPFRYLDASNDMRTLMDETGAAPFMIDGSSNFDFRGMIYDAGTNALFISSHLEGLCGGSAGRLNVRKLPLSADGTRVVGPVICSQFEVSASGENPVGWSHGPSGQLVVVVDTNSNDVEPRMVLVDPVTAGMSALASNGAPGVFAAATNAGTWNSALGKAVILDTGANVLRAFGIGETGAGTVLSISGEILSPNGSSGEQAALCEVEPTACDGAWMAYGAGLAGAGAFVPRLTGGGCPEVGGSLTLTLDRAVGGASSVLFVGLAGAAVPFKGGTFYVGALVLSVPLPMGGAPGAPGAGALTLPAALPANPLLSGVNVHLQAAFTDGAAVKGASLTKGLRMTIGG